MQLVKYIQHRGHRYFSRTAHPRMGYYREHSALWRPTSKIKVKKRCFNKNMYKENYFDNKRLCFSHEYIGDFLLKHDI
jgi:hypothetical protein